MALVLDGTNGVSGVDGTASNPAIEGTDSNTGIFYPAADTVAIGTGGTERLRVDSSGNVGIATTSPDGGLDVEKQNSYFGDTTNGGRLYFRRGVDGSAVGRVGWISGSNVNFEIANDSGSGNILFQTNSAERMRLDASGNLGIGTTTLNQKLNIYGDGTNYSALINFDRGGVYTAQIGTDGAGAIFGSTSNHLTRFITNNTERARITSGGNLLVGQTADSQTTAGNVLYGAGGYSACRSETTNSTSTYTLYSTGASAFRFYVGMGGTINATSTTITGISDVRLKENIRDLDDGLDAVLALKPRKFDWKEGKGANTKDARGFIAQEFEEVFPDMIEQWMDEPPEGEEPYKAVNANLIPTLVKAIQEQQAMIDELKAKVAALKGNA